MNVLRVAYAPRSLVRLAGRTFATYHATAFLDPRAMDRGGQVARCKHESKHENEDQCVAIFVAVLAILATLVLFAMLSLKV
jgi:hypothetical protein